MSDLNKKFLVHSLTYGLIISGVLILLNLLIYIMDISLDGVIFFLYQLLTIVFIAWMMAYASIKFRDKYLDKQIKFVQCFLMGLIAGVVSALLVSFYSYIFNVFFDPSVLEKAKELKISEIAEDDRMSDEMKENIIGNMSKWFDPGRALMISLISMTVLSIMLSLLASLFVRKKEKVPEHII